MNNGTSHSILISVIVALVLVVSGTSLFYVRDSSQQKERLSTLGKEVAVLETNLDSLRKSYVALQTKYAILEHDNVGLRNASEELVRKYNLLKNKSIALDTSMRQKSDEIEQTKIELQEFEITVNDAIAWFKKNTNIGNIDSLNETREKLKKDCLSLSSDKQTCKISLDCLYRVNRDSGITYKYDDWLTSKEDFLQDISHIFSNKGGDCEDFSLLFTSEYNYLVDECGRAGFGRPKMVATIGNEVYSTGGFMSVICGNFKPSGIVQDYAGHCLVALTSSPIVATAGVYQALQDAVLVEPQTGEYIADLNDTDYIELFDDNQPPNTLYYISMVITEDDLKVFYPYADVIKWKGYSDFLLDAQRLRAKVTS